MEIAFSKHANERISARNITEKTIHTVIDEPDTIIQDGACKEIYQKIIKTENSRYLYRVFLNICKTPKLVPTAVGIELQKLKNMNIKFNQETDSVYLKFTNAEIVESDEDKPGIIIDYDKEGSIVGIELLEASDKMKQPGSLVYEVD